MNILDEKKKTLNQKSNVNPQPQQNQPLTQPAQPRQVQTAPSQQVQSISGGAEYKPTNMAAEYDNFKAEQNAQRMVAQPTQGGMQYSSQWQGELDNIMNQIMNREKFSFDMNGDAMAQQYKDMYTRGAEAAMQNAMGQAAAMTGGYGSSYGQMVGQQAYAQQMQGLNDAMPDLYNMALNQYLAEGDALNQRYAMLADKEAQDYARFIDERNQANYEGEMAYQRERDAVSDSQWQQSFDYQKGRDDVADSQWQQSFEYQQGQDALAQQNWQAQFDADQDQRRQDNQYRDEAFAYQQSQDALAQQNWQQSFDYQQDRDAVADSQWDRQFAASEEQRQYENAHNDAVFDYQKERDAVGDSQWQAELNRLLANDATANEQWEKQFAETQEQNDADNKYRNDALAQDNAQYWASLGEDQRQFDHLYGDDGFYDQQNAQDQANWQAQFDYQKERDATSDEQWNALYGEGGLYAQQNGGFSGNYMYDSDGNLREGFTTTNTSFFDENGNFKKATFSRTDEDGNSVWLIDGKEVIRQAGANPYTGSVNPDSKNGTFSNGYQPDNIDGQKLSKYIENGLPVQDYMNGVKQNVWKTPDGSLWIWDGTQNKYLHYEDIEEEKPKTTTSKSGGGGGGGGLGKFATTAVLK